MVERAARFAIVGRNPTKAVESLADRPGVIVTGGVPDVRGWLAVSLPILLVEGFYLLLSYTDVLVLDLAEALPRRKPSPVLEAPRFGLPS